MMAIGTLLPRIKELQSGLLADFTGEKPIDSAELREFLLELDPSNGRTPRCHITNAIFTSKLDLSDGRMPDGSALPALEFCECTFPQGFCTDGAFLHRLKFERCHFVADETINSSPLASKGTEPVHEAPDVSSKARHCEYIRRRPKNSISLRNSRIETELRLECLQPNDEKNGFAHGVLTVDAFAARVGTNVIVLHTTLRAFSGEDTRFTEDANYALDLSTAEIHGDVQLAPRVVLDGGLKMRDCHVGGSLWGVDLRATNGESSDTKIPSDNRRQALHLQTTDIKGNVVFGATQNTSFSAEGTVGLLNANITGEVNLYSEQMPKLVLQGANIQGSLKIGGTIDGIYAPHLQVQGDLELKAIGLEWCTFTDARIAGALNLQELTFREIVENVVKFPKSSFWEPSCYRGRVQEELCDVPSRHTPHKRYIRAIFHTSDGREIPIDGTSIWLHQFNAQNPSPLSLDKVEQARDYLQLFCASVFGEEGSFALVRDRKRLPFSLRLRTFFRSIGQDDIDKLLRIDFGDESKAAEGFQKNKNWNASAFVLYGGILFRSTFKIDRTGLIEMQDDKQIAKYKLWEKRTKVTKFSGRYRVAPVDLGNYWSDFTGKKTVPKIIDQKKREVKERQQYEPNFDFSSCSCKQLKDRRTNKDEKKGSSTIFQNRQLIWDEWPVIHNFTYMEFPPEEDFGSKDRQRFEWVRGYTDLYETDKSAYWFFSLTILFLMGCLYAALCGAWGICHRYSPPSADVSGNFGEWLFAIVLVEWFLGEFIVRTILKRKANKQDKGSGANDSLQFQPFSYLAKVLRERGDDEAAREVEADKMWLEAAKAARYRWQSRLAKVFLWRPYRVMFRFGLSPWRAFWTFVLFWLLGWAAMYMLGANQMLRTSVTPVAPGMLEHKPAVQSGSELADFSCEEEIEPAVYALELMTPILNLHEESKCELRSKPPEKGQVSTPPIAFDPIAPMHIRMPILFSYGWFWEYARAFYIIVGSVITSLALLTVSGIARRWEH